MFSCQVQLHKINRKNLVYIIVHGELGTCQSLVQRHHLMCIEGEVSVGTWPRTQALGYEHEERLCTDGTERRLGLYYRLGSIPIPVSVHGVWERN